MFAFTTNNFKHEGVVANSAPEDQQDPPQDPVGNKLFTLFIICLVLHLIEL